jgi:hypothetical protein
MLGAPLAIKEVFMGSPLLKCGKGHNIFQQGQPEGKIESGRET